jgi:hypothetical protein
MDVDRTAVAGEPARHSEGGGLADEVRIVVGAT